MTLDRLRDSFVGVARSPPIFLRATAPASRRDVDALLAAREHRGAGRRARARRPPRDLDPIGRAHFLEVLADEFGTDADAVDRAAARLRASTPGDVAGAGRARTRVPRSRRGSPAVLHVVTGLPDGVQFLVELRGDLLDHPERSSTLGLLLDELTGHLTTLFDVGLLELRQITWDSPASVLERLIATEAVHEINGWDDLRHRLAGDQRCYGFFHPAMADEPIVFVEVALTHGLADDLPARSSTASDAVDDPDTAIFYSITSVQPGLAGVHLGNELIKQVVDNLRATRDEIKTFATLSPLPGFRAWLLDAARRARAHAGGGRVARRRSRRRGRRHSHDATGPRRPDRRGPPPSRRCCRPRCATSPTARDGRARDPVANFHLIERRVARARQLARQPRAVRHRRVVRA